MNVLGTVPYMCYMGYRLAYEVHDRTWVKFVIHHQVIGQMYFVYLFICLLAYSLTHLNTTERVSIKRIT
jgi:hypothetical protein